MEKVSENINYYSIFCPMFDTDSIELNFLEQIRKKFFESGKKQKNKITKEFEGKIYHYSYAMEDQKPMKWKKMLDGKVLEKSIPNSEGYSISVQSEKKDLIKVICFDNRHSWVKSEYYAKDVKGKPVFSFYKYGNIIKANKYNKNLQVSELCDLYPLKFSTDEYEIDAFNGNLTTIFCKTSNGEISYCTKDQIDKIKDLKKKDIAANEEASEESIRKMADIIVKETEMLVDELSDEIIKTSLKNESKSAESKTNKLYEEVTWEEAISSRKKELNENNLECDGRKMENKKMTKIIKIGENEELFYSGKLDEDQGRSGHGRTYSKDDITIYEGEYLNDKRNGFGVHHYSTGEVFYVGNFKDNNRDRLGILFPKNHDYIQVGSFTENKVKNMVSIFDSEGNLEYAGCIEDGKKTGAAVSYVTDDNEIFVGIFKKGIYTKKGTMFDKEGNLFYTGEFNGKERSGFGTEYNKDATIRYRGGFENNLYNGEGTLYFDDGRHLTGTFKSGKVSGIASEYSKDGRKIYEGTFKDNCYFGEGVIFLENGNYIKGTFIDGKISGTFFEFDENGNMVYEGSFTEINDQNPVLHDFKESKHNGNGALFKNGKCIYKGTFADGVRSGFGIEYDQGKVIYIGDFKDNNYDGCGILFNNNKPIFAGSFRQGKKHGRVNEIYEGKVIKECIFNNDELKYLVEYSYPNMNIVYYGNISAGKKNGMGCEFSEYAEKVNEGIFEDDRISRRMTVCMNEIEPLCECKKLNSYEYDKYRKGADFFIDVNYNGGTYSGAIIDGKPHGKGTILYNDHRYTGEFVNGEPEGNGIIYKNDGTKIKGTFSADKGEDLEEIAFSSGVKYRILNFN